MVGATMAEAYSEIADLSAQQPVDPDAQATVSDFLDYTEFFPSDLCRSLTLIGKLDSKYLETSARVHDLATTYGLLPTLPANERPDPQTLRKQISLALDHAIHCRESAYAEASRLYDVAERHCVRLANIKRKLQALPKPPSRDPTPVPISPQTLRPRKAAEFERPARITLHLDGNRPSARVASSNQASTSARRRVNASVDLARPQESSSPLQSPVSEWETGPVSSSLEGEGANAQNRPGSQGRMKTPKPLKQPKIKIPKIQRDRPQGVVGTNVHSAVAGISTSNALAKLEPPPPDAKPGSKHAPWYKLTEWEMARLRKRMKKNAVWNPSDTMVRRELSSSGRGHENYEKAKAHAEATGEPFLDEDPIDPTKTVLGPGEISCLPAGRDETQLINRGMKLNEAKKLKKETLAREQAFRDAMEIEEASRRVANIGDFMKNLFNGPADGADKKGILSSSKKRKRESSPDAQQPDRKVSQDGNGQAGPKKLKIAPPAAPAPTTVSLRRPRTSPTSATSTVQVPLAPAGPSANGTSASTNRKANSHVQSPPNGTHKVPAASVTATTAAGTRSRRTSVPPKATTPVTSSAAATAAANRPPSRSSRGASAATASHNKAASAEPPGKREPRELRELRELRRGSNVSLPTTPENGATGLRTSTRRVKRPAPGLVTADEDGGSKVSVGKRKAAPKKSAGGAGAKKQKEAGSAERLDSGDAEEIDPDEPTYCLCGDVSYGTMIACENPDCETEWFHLACVGMTEIPPRRTKWYCPDCRTKLRIDEKGHAAEPPVPKRR